MVDKSDIFADDYWKEQWRAVVARERTPEGDDMSVLTMAVQLARRWGPKFCPECEAKSRKLLDLVDAAYKILSARREQMLGERKSARRQPGAEHGANGGSNGNGSEVASMRVLEILEDIRDGLLDLGQNNGRH